MQKPLYMTPSSYPFSLFNPDLFIKGPDYSRCLAQSFSDISPFFEGGESKDQYCFNNEKNQPFLNPNCVRDFVIEENYNFSSLVNKNVQAKEDQNPQGLQKLASEEMECLTPGSVTTNTSTVQNGSESDGLVEKWATKEKYVQNPRKNVPGLVVQRLRSSIFTLLDAQRRTTSKRTNENLAYIQKILSAYNKHEIENLKTQLAEYNKNWKTWKMIGQFVMKDEVFAKMLKEIIEAFLGSEGSEDFDEWIELGKMNAHTKEVIQKSRDWMIEKFAKMFDETEKKEPKKKSRGSKKQKH